MNKQEQIKAAADMDGWLFDEYNEFDKRSNKNVAKESFDRFIENAAKNRWKQQ